MNVFEKMGTFSSIVKRYVKTVDPSVSDHGGHLRRGEFTLFYFLEEKLEYVFCSSM